ncbi:MAG: tetratricopeptide repeat protein [Pirellulales bacterium]|nr:tetratricopeptide repeat protein [Pirellulales bacterium]
MKGERRHELQHNALAEWMVGLVASIKPYTNAILAGVLLVVIVGVATALWVQRSHQQSASAWDEFFTAMNMASAPALDDVAKRYPDQTPGQWASALAGDVRLSQGSQERFASKSAAERELNEAVRCYRETLETSRDGVVRQRATFGLARALESLGNLDEARKQYEELVANWPDGPYADMAQRRADDLNRPATRAFYDQFAKFDPMPATSDDPIIPGHRLPFDESSLPPPGEDLFSSPDPLKLDAAGSSHPAAPDTLTPPGASDTPDAGTPDAGKTPDAAAAPATPPAETPPPKVAPIDPPAPSAPAPQDPPPPAPEATKDK